MPRPEEDDRRGWFEGLEAPLWRQSARPGADTDRLTGGQGDQFGPHVPIFANLKPLVVSGVGRPLK